MSETAIDTLFEDALISDALLPVSDLDIFLDQLPLEDLSPNQRDDSSEASSKETIDDLFEFHSESNDEYVKKEILSDGGSPDSASSNDLYASVISDDEIEIGDGKNIMNVDLFLNKPRKSAAAARADNDVLVNIPTRSTLFKTTRITTHQRRVNTDDIRCSNLKGRDITDEERKMLEDEGVTIPYNVILTKNEERALKRVRRKIKNKISAAESRKRRKEYIGGLEKRVEEHTIINVKLQNTIDELQKRNRHLMEQLKKVANSVKRVTTGSQTATCLMGIFLSFTFFFFPLFTFPFQGRAATTPTSNYIPGRSLLSIPDTPYTGSFMETIMDYIADGIYDITIDSYLRTPDSVNIKGNTTSILLT